MSELVIGVSLGWAAGIAPGPLHTLVFTTTLQRGFGAGARVAVAPLLTDAPVIALAVVTVGSFPVGGLRWLGAAGGMFLVYLGVTTIREAGEGGSVPAAVPRRTDVWRGFATNLLSPHPWLFWLVVGAPILVRAWRAGPDRAIGFLVGFYLLLVGTKIVLAWLVGRGRRRLAAGWYRRLVAIGGALLIGLGAVLLAEAVTDRL